MIDSEIRAAVSPATLHARGVLQLLWQRSDRDLDRAIETLHKAATLAPGNPRLLNDLSAAYLVRSQELQQAADLADALEYADLAIGCGEPLPEARFNRALALQYLHLKRPARDAWGDVRHREPRSPWAEEAAEHLAQSAAGSPTWKVVREALDEAAAARDEAAIETWVRKQLRSSRLYAERTLLARWAEARSAGESKAAENALWEARAIGAAIRRRHGYEILLRAVDAIRQVDGEPGGDRLQALVEGHRTFARADSDRSRCADDFTRARKFFERGGSPFALWAGLELAICKYSQRDLEDALEILGNLRRSVDDTASVFVGRVLWIEGLVRMVQADLGESLQLYEQAREMFTAAGELESSAYLSALSAKNLQLLGASRQAWDRSLTALSATERIEYGGLAPRNAQRIFTIFDGAAEACETAGKPRLAVYFRDEQVAASRRLEQSSVLAAALLRRARLRRQLGDQQAAIEDLSEAREMLRRTEGGELILERVAVDLGVARAQLEDTTLEESLVAYDRALRHFLRPDPQRRDEIEALKVYRLRTSLYRRNGQVELAQADLETAIALVEGQTRRLEDLILAGSFQTQARALYDEMVEFQLDLRGDSDRALDFAERGRNRLVFDRAVGAGVTVKKPASEPLTGRELARAIPEQTAIVVHSVFEQRLVTWVIAEQRVVSHQYEIAREHLRAAVREFRGQILRQETRSELLAAAARLHDLLLPADLPEGATVAFVPDRELAEVPFAALFDATRGRFLIEDHPVAVAPSATLFLENRRRYRERESSRHPGLLVVADPSFDRRRYPGLPYLPAGRDLPRKLAGRYDPLITLIGEEATESRFLKAMVGAELVQFLGHAIAGPRGSPGSGLLLAPEADSPGSGLLRASELDGAHLARIRLLILTSCRTALGGEPEQEGVLSLAASFLAAGVPAVVATLWDIHDRPAAVITELFHRELSAGADPVTALRRAQRRMLEDADPSLSSPFAWAAFELLGGA